MDKFTTAILVTIALTIAMGVALTVLGIVTLVRAVQTKGKGKFAGVFSIFAGVLAVAVPLFFVLYMGYLI